MSVRDGLLVLLSAHPGYGYQLKADLEHSSASDRSLNIGQIYTTLDRLQRDGLVEELEAPAEDDAAEQDRRRRFAATAAGRAQAQAWLREPATDPVGRDEVVTRVLLAIASTTVDPIEVIDRQREAVLARLQATRRRLRSAPDPLVRIATDAAAARLEATLSWLDRTEAGLRDATRGGSNA